MAIENMDISATQIGEDDLYSLSIGSTQVYLTKEEAEYTIKTLQGIINQEGIIRPLPLSEGANGRMPAYF